MPKRTQRQPSGQRWQGQSLRGQNGGVKGATGVCTPAHQCTPRAVHILRRTTLGYRVREGDTEREIRYLPEGRTRITLQELELDPALDDAGRRACAKRLGGE